MQQSSKTCFFLVPPLLALLLAVLLATFQASFQKI